MAAALNLESQHRSIFDDTYAEDIDSDGDAVEYLPPDEDGGESVLDNLNKRKAELERRTRDEPSDVEAWLVAFLPYPIK